MKKGSKKEGKFDHGNRPNSRSKKKSRNHAYVTSIYDTRKWSLFGWSIWEGRLRSNLKVEKGLFWEGAYQGKFGLNTANSGLLRQIRA